MLFILIFLIVFLFNLYIVIFGKKDLQKLKEKISIKKYLEEMNDTLKSSLGESEAKWLKGGMIILSAMIILFNAYFFLAFLLAIALGTFAAKKSYQIPITSNIINKIATYINRLR